MSRGFSDRFVDIADDHNDCRRLRPLTDCLIFSFLLPGVGPPGYRYLDLSVRTFEPESIMSEFDLRIEPKAATLRHLVEDKLRQAIASGVFKPGQRLIERELCEMTGVGRTSIREALRQLEADGLITTIPHRGPSVSVITEEDALQLYEIRAVLESFAGQAFAERASEENIRRLSEAVERIQSAADTGNRADLIGAKTDFYEVLLAGCGNIYVEKTLRGLHDRITLLRVASMTQPGRLQHSIREIRDIHQAIVARDGQAAAAACRHHIDQAAAAVMEFLRSETQANA